MLNTMKPATGRLLIAEPFMLDPQFKRSVVLLTEYTTDGVVGFVLNHASGLYM
ncbi:MAG: YqgE/AlgH family protein, partial [Sphingobacteriaceae bacterium]